MASVRRAKPAATGGTSPGGYHALIWKAVRRIPRGSVATYGQVAALAGFPNQPRLAGYALHALPPGSGVPWHRVINAQGRISLTPGSGGDVQARLLKREGVSVGRGGRIDLERFRWKAGLARRPVRPR